jgi:hypothetical protein
VLGIVSLALLVATTHYILSTVSIVNLVKQAIILLPTSITALFTGINSISKIEKNHYIKGIILARTGLIIGGVIVVLYVLILLLGLAIHFLGVP